MCFSRLRAHILLIALSIIQHKSIFSLAQLKDIYLQFRCPSVLSYAQLSNYGLFSETIGSIISACKSNPSFHLFVSTHSCLFHSSYHCVKIVQIWSFFSSVFCCIWTEYRVNLYFQSEYRKIQTRKNSAFGHVLRSGDTHLPFS